MGVGAGWYYDSLNGDVTHQNWFESLANIGFSYFHGPYATSALAVAHKGVKGPPGHVNESLISQAGSVATGGPSGTGSILGIPTGRKTVMRLAEGALGVLLILVGVAKLAEGSPIAAAIKKVPII